MLYVELQELVQYFLFLFGEFDVGQVDGTWVRIPYGVPALPVLCVADGYYLFCLVFIEVFIVFFHLALEDVVYNLLE